MYKTKKISKQSILTLVMALALIVTMTFSLTRAWFVTRFSDQSTLTFGNISVTDPGVDYFTSITGVTPNQEVELEGFTLNVSHNIPVYARMKITLTAVEMMKPGPLHYRPYVDGDTTPQTGDYGPKDGSGSLTMLKVVASGAAAGEVNKGTITPLNWRGAGIRTSLPEVNEYVTLVPEITDGYPRLHEISTATLDDDWFVGFNNTYVAPEEEKPEKGYWKLDATSQAYYWATSDAVNSHTIAPTDHGGVMDVTPLEVFVADTAIFKIPSTLTLEDAGGKTVTVVITYTVIQADNVPDAGEALGTLAHVLSAFATIDATIP